MGWASKFRWDPWQLQKFGWPAVYIIPASWNSLKVMNTYVHDMLLVTGVEGPFASKAGEPGETCLCKKNTWYVSGLSTRQLLVSCSPHPVFQLSMFSP